MSTIILECLPYRSVFKHMYLPWRCKSPSLLTSKTLNIYILILIFLSTSFLPTGDGVRKQREILGPADPFIPP